MIHTYNRFRIQKNSFAGCAQGFSMIELLVAMTIIAVMIVLMMFGQGLQIGKGEDAVRKNDFSTLKIAFEDYYNDNGCYPPPELLDQCESDEMQPYLSRVPCDPRTREPYEYHRDSACRWYALFTTLIDVDDPAIETIGCFPTCGIPGKPFNYVMTNGAVPLPSIMTSLGGQAQPTPTPTPVPGPYACDPVGQCNSYSDPIGSGCPVTYANASVCQAACAIPANRCDR